VSTDDNLKLPKEIEAYCKDEDKDRELEEKKYPCADCGKLRTAGEGGTTFTVCDECWDKSHKKPTSDVNKDRELRDILGECGLDAPDEDEIQKAMGLIEALYKPLLEELEYLVNGIKRYLNDPYQEELPEIKDAAQAIINARGK